MVIQFRVVNCVRVGHERAHVTYFAIWSLFLQHLDLGWC